jgi:hypothetical protein
MQIRNRAIKREMIAACWLSTLSSDVTVRMEDNSQKPTPHPTVNGWIVSVGKDWLFENLPEDLRVELFCELAGIE